MLFNLTLIIYINKLKPIFESKKFSEMLKWVQNIETILENTVLQDVLKKQASPSVILYLGLYSVGISII